MFYLRRKAYDPSIIYFKDVVRLYPTTKHAEMALLRLVEAYGKIKYKEEVAETCATLREKYAGDKQVTDACGPAPATAAAPKP
jgi:outer membrane protein assembly factor BamD